MQLKKNAAVSVFFYLDLLTATVANITCKRTDKGSIAKESLTYTTQFTCVEIGEYLYRADILANVLDTIGENILTFSYTGSNNYDASVDVVDNLVSDNNSLLDTLTLTCGTILSIGNTLNTNIGTPANIDSGGATISDNLKKLADDSAGLAYDATADSAHTKTGGLSAQEVRDSMLLAPTPPGIAIENSIDNKIDDIPTTDVSGDITAIKTVTDKLASIDGLSPEIALKQILSMATGKFIRTDDSYDFYAQDNSTLLFTLIIAAEGRTRV